METLNQLSKITTKSRRRVGRGIGSGSGGHTTGRGAKGDKVRGKTKMTFDGTKIKKSWIKRLPFLRGKHRLLSKNIKTVFNLSQLEKWFKDQAIVDKKSLSEKSKQTIKGQIKILSKGNLSKKLTIKGMLISEIAKKKIIAAGGKIE